MYIRKNKIMERYLIQPPEKTPFDQKKELFGQVWKDTVINHLIKIPTALDLTVPIIQKCLKNVNKRDAFKMDDLKTFGLHLLVSVLIEDALFYWSHRLLHTSFLFKHVHRKHHEFHNLASYPIASEYTHPVESLLGNILPVMVGPIVTGQSFMTLQIWLWIRMLKTSDAHCGYHFPFSPFGMFWPFNEAPRHDFHHEKGVGSFGSFFQFWDNVCGTDAQYVAFRAKKEAKAAKALTAKKKE
jgi:sterol desaturase/sphingolipid hydroxylase (fatty acid hydroxylase superfamily)